MPAFNRFNAWTDTMVEAANCGTDQFAIALTNTAPSASNTVLADITEIAYTGFGSRNLTTTSSSQTGGVYSLVWASLTLGTTVTSATFRYVVIYDDTLAGDPLVGWYDLGVGTTIPANTSLILSGMGLDLDGSSFDPLELFSGGEEGAWYDHSNIGSLYRDWNAIVPVSTNGDTIGLEIDLHEPTLFGSWQTATSHTNAGATWDTLTDDGLGGFFAEKTTGGGTDISNSNAIITAVVNEWWEIEANVTATTLSSYSLAIFNGTNSRIPTPQTLSGTGVKRVYVYLNSAAGSPLSVGIATSSLGNITVAYMRARRVYGNHLFQSTSAQRELYDNTSSLYSDVADGVDDNFTARTGGGGTTAFCYMSVIKPTQVGVRQTLFSDAGTNTGYKVELNTSNQLVLSAGNGTTYTTVTTANTFTNGQVVSVLAFDDGTNLSVSLNNGTPVTAARPTVTAGTSTLTVDKDNGAASGYFKGNCYGRIYGRNTAWDSTKRANAIAWLRAKGGI